MLMSIDIEAHLSRGPISFRSFNFLLQDKMACYSSAMMLKYLSLNKSAALKLLRQEGCKFN